jgi:hypothetical protein
MANEATPDLEWTDSKVESAALILQQGFAVLSVDEDTTRIFQQAAELSLAFLLESSDCSDENGNVPSSSRSNNKFAYQRVSTNGHLMGYNEPSAAKLLYRAFLDMENDLQPWPNASLQNASEIAAQALYDILTDCYSEIRQRILPQPNVNSPKAEEKRCFSRASCPLDYFYYHGRGAPGVVNCSPHTDRGVLIAVVLTNVPGLEVLLPDSRSDPPSFSCYCPEQVHVDRLVAQPYSLVCIMAGDHLHRLFNQIDCVRDGCVHRVRDNLPSPRLSISYEIRL